MARVTKEQLRAIHARNRGVSKDIGQSRRFLIRNPTSNEKGMFPRVSRVSPIDTRDDIHREQKEELADLEHIERTDPKRFREIQLREGAFDDVLTIEEIDDELRKLGAPDRFFVPSSIKPTLPRR